MALELFLIAFDANRGNVKFLSAIEFAAVRSGRPADLIRIYEARANEDRHLFGRLRSLRRRASP